MLARVRLRDLSAISGSIIKVSHTTTPSGSLYYLNNRVVIGLSLRRVYNWIEFEARESLHPKEVAMNWFSQTENSNHYPALLLSRKRTNVYRVPTVGRVGLPQRVAIVSDIRWWAEIDNAPFWAKYTFMWLCIQSPYTVYPCHHIGGTSARKNQHKKPSMTDLFLSNLKKKTRKAQCVW